MGATPAINDWVATLVEADPTLRAAASACCASAPRSATPATRSTGCGDPRRTLAYQKMLAALWRESPVPRLADGERLATMASLLHRDPRRRALVGRADRRVRASSPTSWLRSYLHAYVAPIVHCLLAHDLAFMPHGENVVLVLRDGVPVRALMKDIGEEVAVMGDHARCRRRWSGSGSRSPTT